MRSADFHHDQRPYFKVSYEYEIMQKKNEKKQETFRVSRKKSGLGPQNSAYFQTSLDTEAYLSITIL